MHGLKLLAGVGLAVLASWANAQAVRIGVLAGIDAEVMQHAAQVAAAKGLTLQIQAYPDISQLRAAVAQGAVDGASVPDAQTLARWQQPALKEVGTSITLPMGLYSRQLPNLRALRNGARIGIPAESGAQSRALILLQNYGLIQLRDSAGIQARIADVTVNPRGYQLVALPEARLLAALPKLPLVALPGDFALQHQLYPARDALGMEDARSPWAGVLAAVTPGAWTTQWRAAYQSPAVAAFVLTRYQDSVRRPW
ncbi:MetQ/NlpA family ABC transporter substrate-binding protein [Amantichitinum ursilacus]|uniref:Putative D-methionine-binding lipoprotein MetQ n=1 Tax=Amantichitinum ursilacus TaxID=857265 RepID=A0A0N0XFY7_9NEIS|nr:MetQ/NlpA family ABC transporter substrate-binding protein [Amantichitinum ursilacus]KPC49551.1 putative D-methionine-binding lipoprotein MetQ precursor [Amantichitinum ursilacus]